MLHLFIHLLPTTSSQSDLLSRSQTLSVSTYIYRLRISTKVDLLLTGNAYIHMSMIIVFSGKNEYVKINNLNSSSKICAFRQSYNRLGRCIVRAFAESQRARVELM